MKLSFVVLAVENSSAHGLLLEQALSPLSASFRLLSNAREAREYLATCAQWGSVPDAVLLDFLQLDASGLDLLRWIRVHPAFQDLPVVVLSGRDDASDVNRAYELGIAGYVAKRAGLRELAMTLSGVLVSQGPPAVPQGHAALSTR